MNFATRMTTAIAIAVCACAAGPAQADARPPVRVSLVKDIYPGEHRLVPVPVGAARGRGLLRGVQPGDRRRALAHRRHEARDSARHGHRRGRFELEPTGRLRPRDRVRVLHRPGPGRRAAAVAHRRHGGAARCPGSGHRRPRHQGEPGSPARGIDLFEAPDVRGLHASVVDGWRRAGDRPRTPAARSLRLGHDRRRCLSRRLHPGRGFRPPAHRRDDRGHLRSQRRRSTPKGR